MRFLLVALAALLGACNLADPQPSAFCSDNAECASGGCTRAQICSNSPAALTVHWTINGVTPSLASPGACTTIGDLRLELAFKSEESLLRYSPVPCAAGLSRIDNLPMEELTRIGLSAVNSSSIAADTTRDSAAPRTGSPGEYDVTLALTQ